MKNLYEFPILIVGVGSIGERYIKNLWALGFKNIHAFRKRNLPFNDIGNAKVSVHLFWKDVKKIRPFVSIISTPTSLHLEYALKCADLGSHLLIEKPLSNTLKSFDKLEDLIIERNIYLRIAYMMRFHPQIIKIKEIISSKKFGNLLSYRSKWGEYLPDWHPWEDYRKSYASNKELGGGVALTLSHDVDLSNWLCDSEVNNHVIFRNYRSNLEVNVESGADILIRYANGIISNIHLNYFEKKHERYLKLIFDDASIHFDYYQNFLEIKTPKHIKKNTIKNFNRNNMYIEELKHFFDCLKNYSISDSLNQINESKVIINICK